MKTVVWFLASLSLLSSNAAFAGNVRASISGGNLYIYGDESGNSVVIDSSGAGNIRVTGIASMVGPTTVNARSNPAIFNNWTGGIFVYLYGGDDTLTLVNGDVRGAVHIDLGTGNDDAYLGEPLEAAMTFLLSGAAPSAPLTLRSTLFIIGSSGADIAAVDNARVVGRSTIDLGSQSDEFTAADVSFGDNLVILPADGGDYGGLFNCSVTLDLVIDDSVGALTADIDDVQIGRNAFIYGTSSVDSVVATDFRVANLFQVFGEQGADDISLGGQAKILEVFAGSDADRVTLSQMSSPTTRVYLDAGSDSLTIGNSNITTLNAFGGADNDTFTIQSSVVSNANIYGDGGTDTFRRSSATINRFNLYSIEVR